MNVLPLIDICEKAYSQADLETGPNKRDGASITTLADGTIVVAFRGTLVDHDFRSFIDWINDFKVELISADGFPGRVHVGFLEVLANLKPKLTAVCSFLRAPDVPTIEIKPWWKRWMDRFAATPWPTLEESAPKIIFTGHSLGGAIAQLAGVVWQHLRPLVITFAAPMCGDLDFAAGYPHELVTLIRYESADDIVPWTPPWGYRSAGEVIAEIEMPWRLRYARAHALMADLIHIPTMKATWEKVAAAHHLANYRQWIAKRPPEDHPQVEAA